MNIGNALKLCRNTKMLSLAEVAERAGFSISYVSLIESGKRDPSVKVVEALARAMKIPTPIVMFLAAEADEINGLDRREVERLSTLALGVLRASPA